MAKIRQTEPRRLHTIGHSTRTIEELIALLHANGIERLADIRRFPGSRRYPHFSPPQFEQAITAAGLAYLHLPQLGGRRPASRSSVNAAWRNASFRGYADHMASHEFRSGLEKLLSVDSSTAIMCAEAVPWRCHRNLVSDALVAHGIEVIHILDATSTRIHTINPNARIAPDGTVTYPAEPPQRELF